MQQNKFCNLIINEDFFFNFAPQTVYKFNDRTSNCANLSLNLLTRDRNTIGISNFPRKFYFLCPLMCYVTR